MRKFADNAFSTLASGITASATSLTVAAGHGARFPVADNANYFLCTLFQVSDNVESNHETVKVTATSGDVFTIKRAQEGTIARAFNAGDPIELRWTRSALDSAVLHVAHKFDPHYVTPAQAGAASKANLDAHAALIGTNAHSFAGDSTMAGTWTSNAPKVAADRGSVDQLIPHLTDTLVTWPAVEYGSLTSNKFQPNKAGYYFVTANLSTGIFSTDDLPDNGKMFIKIFKNGALYKQSMVLGHNPPSIYYNAAVSALVYLNGSTDYVEIYVFQRNPDSSSVALFSTAASNLFHALYLNG